MKNCPAQRVDPRGMQLTGGPHGGMIFSMIFTDEYGIPLPRGTAIDLQPSSPHTGIIDYLQTGDQVVIHNSKQRGQGVVTWPEEFNDGFIPVRYIAVPLSEEQGELICQNAQYDVQRGVRWNPGDNCQDLVTRAYTGRNGSPTRDAVVLTLAVAGGLALAGRVIAEIFESA